MKKRTLNQTWTLCLRMWRSVSKKWTGKIPVWRLKRRWIRANGFAKEDIKASCFFCDYDEHNNKDYCDSCPGRLVDSDFDCNNELYVYRDKPVEFYRKLLRLNRIRKAKK